MNTNITRIALVAVIVIGSAGAGGIGTMAYLSDQDSTEATINVGTLDVTTAESITFAGEENPGGETVTIENRGTLPVRQLNMTGIALSTGNGSASELASYFTLTELSYDGDSLLDQVEDENENGETDVEDLQTTLDEGNVVLVGDGSTLDPGNSATLSVDGHYNYTAMPNTFNGETLTVDLDFRGYQEPP